MITLHFPEQPGVALASLRYSSPPAQCEACLEGMVFPHRDRRGQWLCGACWSKQETDAHEGRRARSILAEGRIYKRHPLETLRQIQRLFKVREEAT